MTELFYTIVTIIGWRLATVVKSHGRSLRQYLKAQ
jgi:hypothetical protein